MVSFISTEELNLSNKFLKDGYLIKKISDQKALSFIKKLFLKSIRHKKEFKKIKDSEIFDKTHKYLKKNNLNDFRLNLINILNNNKYLRKNYFLCAQPLLDLIVGNELVMQKRVNLSIQLPNDDSSLLDVHADVWSGDSPYEAVAWMPLVNCFKSKSMYILPFNKYKKYEKNLFDGKVKNSENLYNKIKKDVHWLNVKYGEILIFNQCLPHGNIVNKTDETRWSMNCRFKSVYSPYFDKKIGEFFEPVTLKPISKSAIKYNFPKIK